MKPIRFFVPGLPATQGSKKQVPGAGGRTLMIESADKKLRPWRKVVSLMARRHCRDPLPKDTPIELRVLFVFPRPKGHYVASTPGRPLKAKAPRLHLQKPDLDKLTRAIGDALTDVTYFDDSAIVCIGATKVWGDPGEEGVHVDLREYHDEIA